MRSENYYVYQVFVDKRYGSKEYNSFEILSSIYLSENDVIGNNGEYFIITVISEDNLIVESITDKSINVYKVIK